MTDMLFMERTVVYGVYGCKWCCCNITMSYLDLICPSTQDLCPFRWCTVSRHGTFVSHSLNDLDFGGQPNPDLGPGPSCESTLSGCARLEHHISTHWNLHKSHDLNKSYIKMWKNLHQLVHRAWKLFWPKMATVKRVEENLRLNCLLIQENLAEASKNLARREHPVNTNSIPSKKTTSDSFCINKSKYWFLYTTPQCSAFCLQTLAVVRQFHFRGGGSLFTSAGFPALMLLFGSSLIEC